MALTSSNALVSIADGAGALTPQAAGSTATVTPANTLTFALQSTALVQRWEIRISSTDLSIDGLTCTWAPGQPNAVTLRMPLSPYKAQYTSTVSDGSSSYASVQGLLLASTSGVTISPTYVTSLRSITPTNTRQTQFCDAYAALGDGGGGFFAWDAANVSADDGGTVFQVAGQATGRWTRIYSGPLNLKWYGVKGDGVTDDAANVLACIAAGVALGVGVFAPGGDYLCKSSIEMDQILAIEGIGANTTISAYYADPAWLTQGYKGTGSAKGTVFRFPNATNGFTRNGANSIATLRGVVIVGNGNNATTGVYCNPAVNGRLYLDNVIVANWWIGRNGGVDLGADGRRCGEYACVYGHVINDAPTSCHQKAFTIGFCTFAGWHASGQVMSFDDGVFEGNCSGIWYVGLQPREHRLTGSYQEVTGASGLMRLLSSGATMVPGQTISPTRYNNSVYWVPPGGGGTLAVGTADPAGMSTTITGMVVGATTQLTVTGHGFTTGQMIAVNPGTTGSSITPTGNLTILTSNHAAIGSARPYGWQVTVIDANTITIPCNTTAGLNTSNGSVSALPYSVQISAIDGTGPGGTCKVTTSTAHGLKLGSWITMYSIVGTTECNTSTANQSTARIQVATVVDATHFTVAITFVNAYVSGGCVNFYPTYTDGTVKLEYLNPGGGVGTNQSSLTGAGCVIDIRQGTCSSYSIEKAHCSDVELVIVFGAYGTGNTVNSLSIDTPLTQELWIPPSVNGTIIGAPGVSSIQNNNPGGFGQVGGQIILTTTTNVRYPSGQHAITFRDAAGTGTIGGMELQGATGNETLTFGANGSHQPDKSETYGVNLHRWFLGGLETLRTQPAQLILGLGITGAYGLEFGPSTTPYIKPQAAGSDVATGLFTMYGRDAFSTASTNVNGGALGFAGGNSKTPGVTGTRGGVRLGLGAVDTNNLVEVTEPLVGQRVVGLCQLTATTSSQMGASTGDAVIFIANCQTPPSASASAGGILYVQGGALKYRGSAGTVTTIGPA